MKEIISTVVVALILACVLGMIVYNQYKRKKQGKGSCSCGCGGCAMSDVCHSKKE